MKIVFDHKNYNTGRKNQIKNVDQSDFSFYS
jgi:hypothetical protein